MKLDFLFLVQSLFFEGLCHSQSGNSIEYKSGMKIKESLCRSYALAQIYEEKDLNNSC
ncbi:hypothetical protein [Clostridium sp.]|uniref:hypothetical protein n=1 Tax=Clostridium sp. TaxID=1506 RepID=UPI002A88FCBB|nr:hypothetical protein [Clostridium sp.]